MAHAQQERIPGQMIAQESAKRRIDDWLRHVLSALVDNPVEHFSGVGLILYNAPLALPVLPMARDASLLSLPTQSVNESISLLRTICRVDSDFHDGFHLVDANTLQISHVSNFFAPPIVDIPLGFWRNQHIGARFVSAWLGSFIPSVCKTAILSKEEGGIVFTAGKATHILTMQK